MISAFDFAVNMVMVINIAIHKTFIIHDSVKKLFMLQCLQPREYNALISSKNRAQIKIKFIQIKSRKVRIYSYLSALKLFFLLYLYTIIVIWVYVM